MSQAQPNPAPRRRPSRGRLKPVEKQERPGRRGGATARQATVTPIEPRRRIKTAKGGLPRLPLFLAGIGLGYGLNGPLPHLATGLLAGLHHPSNMLGSLVAPAGMGDRRIVVMGTDHVSTNTDVMFTVQLRDGRTELTQVPRDTFIESERYGVMKANALYSSGGPEMVKQELSKLLSAKVDRYLVLNLNAVQRLADALGGVEVDVPKRMYYVDNSQGLYIDLYPGRQLLKGEALEGFLRFRHDELGDIGRMERQKLVLKEVFKKLANPAMATRLPELMTIAGKDVLTDLSPVDMGALVSAMATTKLSSSRLEGTPYWHEDISYWLPDANPHRDLYRSQEQPPL
ncbi:MAG: LytR family transcriptional regulator [Cyanobacteria bacterium M_surface_7_m2_037]|nr:LytR family transcriptional regulator [Cyanobacteria bacterium M_surface_7_m2_037]MBM5819673.1 LytR family transcriptional regulator [Cyanobacteria bacterium K_DeepCast_150m_m2_101]